MLYFCPVHFCVPTKQMNKIKKKILNKWKRLVTNCMCHNLRKTLPLICMSSNFDSNYMICTACSYYEWQRCTKNTGTHGTNSTHKYTNTLSPIPFVSLTLNIYNNHQGHKSAHGFFPFFFFTSSFSLLGVEGDKGPSPCFSGDVLFSHLSIHRFLCLPCVLLSSRCLSQNFQ